MLERMISGIPVLSDLGTESAILMFRWSLLPLTIILAKSYGRATEPSNAHFGTVNLAAEKALAYVHSGLAAPLFVIHAAICVLTSHGSRQ